MRKEDIISVLPYDKPFLFVDHIESITEENVIGYYQFKQDEYFYQGHFKGDPITPGVIITECMAQIGLVCLGIYLSGNTAEQKPAIALSETNIQFLKKVAPNERLKVVSEKIYYRFGKLKCNVITYNEHNEKVAEGTISGMIVSK